MFVDELTITVRSGGGGRGCESFFTRGDRKRIPEGGDGGKGGDVILTADPQTGSLAFLKSKPMFEAERGGHGMGHNCYGRTGKDCIVKVPCGTTVYNKRDHLLIRDLVLPSDAVTVLKGGKGGHGNHNGGASTEGEVPLELELFLSYKIIADVFLVGLPNSGKTAFLKTLTGAGVTETDYPFATKSPQLGTYATDAAKIRICDLPSLYEASSEGGGVGTHFLKHLERAKLVFFVLDAQSKFAVDLRSGFCMLLELVKSMNLEFAGKPRFVVVNKMDLVPERNKKALLLPKGEKCFLISVRRQTSIKRLMAAAEKELEKSL